ncbi:hypothetical protein KUTeg_020096 [Tegillarca granosa]|uniref:Uncharacterized protein n=1 Tax=Tegillarca granosa TaxID=220873 RepID=A0ABQ9E9J8_TEGGR|nr:hypothetical protein KUTeg_020096 [Tegillarca granosa]
MIPLCKLYNDDDDDDDDIILNPEQSTIKRNKNQLKKGLKGIEKTWDDGNSYSRRASKANIKGLKDKKGKGGGAGKDKARMKAGKRNADSDSDYSYRSSYTPGGTRHVRRKKKNADGTYGDS